MYKQAGFIRRFIAYEIDIILVSAILIAIIWNLGFKEVGDILIPLNEGRITEKDFTGELGNVIKGDLIGRENDDEIIVFETVGVTIQDLVTAKAIYDRAIGVGVKWN